VRLAAAEEPTAVGETTTVAVVVESADGGVGAYDLTVAVEDPDVASVVDVAVAGGPGARDVGVAPDGSNASVRAALMDTDDAGEVTVATVTVRGESVGSADLGVSVETLGDERGRAYAVTAERGASVAVAAAEDSTDRSDDDASDSTADDSGLGDDASDATADDPEPGDGGADASGDDGESGASDSGAGSESDSDADAEGGSGSGTGTTETDTGSDADASVGGSTSPVRPVELGAVSAPAASLLLAALALLVGAIYLRRRR
jgi:hypothetical protein